MPWKEETLMTQKRGFVEDHLRGNRPLTELCKQYGISRPTAYKWLSRYSRDGFQGLKERSRRPKQSPTKTSKKIESDIVEVRRQYPRWGARKISAYLKRQGKIHLPAVSTITEILRRHGLLSKEECMKRQALGRFEMSRSNELWQMDFKGHFKLEDKERCYPLTILDDYSRYSIGLRACRNEKRITVQSQLEIIFKVYGLPERINVDNGNPWGNSRGKGYTHLTVWLMQLGIKVSHSRPYHPQTNGKDERFHRTLKHELLSQRVLNNMSHAQKLFNEWRSVYNEIRPHEALGMKVPCERYTPSKLHFPSRVPLIEYDEYSDTRKVRGNGFISYRGEPYLVGEAFSGKYILVKVNDTDDAFQIYFGKHLLHRYELTNHL